MRDIVYGLILIPSFIGLCGVALVLNAAAVAAGVY